MTTKLTSDISLIKNRVRPYLASPNEVYLDRVIRDVIYKFCKASGGIQRLYENLIFPENDDIIPFWNSRIQPSTLNGQIGYREGLFGDSEFSKVFYDQVYYTLKTLYYDSRDSSLFLSIPANLADDANSFIPASTSKLIVGGNEFSLSDATFSPVDADTSVTGELLPIASGNTAGFSSALTGSTLTPTTLGLASVVATSLSTPARVTSSSITPATRAVAGGTETGVSAISGEELGTIDDATFTFNSQTYNILEIIYFVPTTGTPTFRFRVEGDLELGIHPQIALGSTVLQINDATRTLVNTPEIRKTILTTTLTVGENAQGFKGFNGPGSRLGFSQFNVQGEFGSFGVPAGSFLGGTLSGFLIPFPVLSVYFDIIINNPFPFVGFRLDIDGVEFTFATTITANTNRFGSTLSSNALEELFETTGRVLDFQVSVFENITLYEWSGDDAPSSNPFVAGTAIDFELDCCNLDNFIITLGTSSPINTANINYDDQFDFNGLILPARDATTTETSLTWDSFSQEVNVKTIDPFYVNGVISPTVLPWSYDATVHQYSWRNVGSNPFADTDASASVLATLEVPSSDTRAVGVSKHGQEYKVHAGTSLVCLKIVELRGTNTLLWQNIREDEAAALYTTQSLGGLTFLGNRVYTIISPNTMLLWPLQGVPETLTEYRQVSLLRVLVAPAFEDSFSNQSSFPIEINEHYVDVIVAGALAELMQLPKSSDYNLSMANIKYIEFQQGVTDLASRVRKDFSDTTERLSTPVVIPRRRGGRR